MKIQEGKHFLSIQEYKGFIVVEYQHDRELKFKKYTKKEFIKFFSNNII